MSAYYNEIDPKKAAWLRELIRVGAIAPGDVDERSILDVRADDLAGYRQCHWFAGVGIWSYALRLAGWPDDRPVWTGSCPCPSFSAAGKGQGFDDPRHLWPAWHRLIRESKPPICFGEQVDAAIGHGWLDLVQADLEAEAYAVGKAVLGACSVGAPHRRQRLFFVADSQRKGLEGDARASVQRGEYRPTGRGEYGIVAEPASARHDNAREHGGGSPLFAARFEQRGGDGLLVNAPRRGCGERGDAPLAGRCGHADGAGIACELGDAGREGLPLCECKAVQRAGRRGEGRAASESGSASGELADAGHDEPYRRYGSALEEGQVEQGHLARSEPTSLRGDGILAYADGRHASDGDVQRSGQQRFEQEDSGVVRVADAGSGFVPLSQRGPQRRDGTRPNSADDTASAGRPSPLNGFWRDADWLRCRDGKWRPVESGTFPLAHGAPARVVRLRGFGDGIAAQAAAAFVGAYMETVVTA